MIHLMGTKMPQGEALTQALKESEVFWSTGRQGEGRKRPRSLSPEPDRRVEVRSGATRQKCVVQAKGGFVCVSWNLGKCTAKKKDCPRGFVHACKVMVGDRPCGDRSHTTSQHKS